MYADKPQTPGDVMTRNEYAKNLHQSRIEFAKEVELVLTGDYEVPHEYVEEAGTSSAAGYGSGSLEIQRPSRALNLHRKMVSMLGVRAGLTLNVPTISSNPPIREQKLCEKLETGLHQYVRTIDVEHNTNIVRDFVAWAALRGVAYMITNYRPVKPDPYGLYAAFPIQSILPDPNTLFVVRGHTRAPIWFTRDSQMTAMQVLTWLNRIHTDGTEWEKPDLSRFMEESEYGPDLSTEFRVVEYLDARYRAIVIEGEEMIGPLEHGYGYLPLAELRFDELPIDDERWRQVPFIGRVLDDLKGETVLMAKMASAVNAIFWPMMAYFNEDNIPAFAKPNEPGTWAEGTPNTRFEIMNPTINAQVFEILRAWYRSNETQGTVPDLAFMENFPAQMSGFGISQVLGVLQDQIEDITQAIERGLGRWLGNVLRCAEQFADAQTQELQDAEGFEPGVFILPGYQTKAARTQSRGSALTLGKDDIQGHHHVEVIVKPKLPQDDVQRMTLLNQGRALDGLGRPMVGLRTAFEMSGQFEDVNAAVEEVQEEWLIKTDPVAQQVHADMLRAEYLKKHRKDWERAQKTFEREMEKHDKKQPTDIPDELLLDPNFYEHMLMALESGADPQDVLASLRQEAEGGGGLAPPLAQREETPEGLPGMLQAQEGGMPTGIEGMDNRAMPPEFAAPNRKAVDDPNLIIERVQERLRRGAKPPPR